MRAITAEDLLTYRFIENLQYNKDGSMLAYQIAFADKKKNTYHRNVWVYEDDLNRQLTSTLDASIVCWKDIHTLLVRRETEEKKEGYTELFAIDVFGGEAMPVAQLPLTIKEMKRAENGMYYALCTIDTNCPDFYKLDEKQQEEVINEKKDNADYQVITEISFWMNGQNYINGMRTALFAISSDFTTVERLTTPLFDTGEMLVDGNDVYFTGYERKAVRSMFNQVYVYHGESKEMETVYGGDDLTISSLFKLEGKLYGQTTDHKTYGTNETKYISQIENGQVTKIIKPEFSLHCSVGADTMLGGGKSAAVCDKGWVTTTTEDVHTPLYVFTGSEQMERIDCGKLSISFMDAVKDHVAVCAESDESLAEIYVLTESGFEKITSHNDHALVNCYVAAAEEVSYTSCGENLKGWVLKPKDYDPLKKYPAVLEIHGGPRTVYGTRFNHEMQMLAGMGFFVFFTNIRGSDGRGDAFADIRGKYGEVDYQNLMDFTDAVLAAYPSIDETRVCETGGSYGGFMTNWIIGHTHRFCCAVSQRSISNWISKSFISDIGFYFGPDQCGTGDDPFNFDKLWEHSPLKYAKGAVTPTLFIHSDEDRRCPLPEGMQMLTALALQGVETKMVVFHGETHELSRSGKPLHRLRRLHEIADWFVNHTKKED